MGGKLLDDFFPKPPGPFKRVGALLVMNQLNSFFYFDPPLNADQSQRWRAKVSALLIPVALAKLRVNLTPDKPNPTWHRLDAWKGFPSPHFKMELLQYLEGMDNYEWVERLIEGTHLADYKDRLITEKTARKIAATGLIIEACYYFNEGEHSAIRGKCNDFFNVDDINFIREFHYDRQIYRAASGKKDLFDQT